MTKEELLKIINDFKDTRRLSLMRWKPERIKELKTFADKLPLGKISDANMQELKNFLLPTGNTDVDHTLAVIRSHYRVFPMLPPKKLFDEYLEQAEKLLLGNYFVERPQAIVQAFHAEIHTLSDTQKLLARRALTVALLATSLYGAASNYKYIKFFIGKLGYGAGQLINKNDYVEVKGFKASLAWLIGLGVQVGLDCLGGGGVFVSCYIMGSIWEKYARMALDKFVITPKSRKAHPEFTLFLEGLAEDVSFAIGAGIGELAFDQVPSLLRTTKLESSAGSTVSTMQQPTSPSPTAPRPTPNKYFDEQFSIEKIYSQESCAKNPSSNLCYSPTSVLRHDSICKIDLSSSFFKTCTVKEITHFEIQSNMQRFQLCGIEVSCERVVEANGLKPSGKVSTIALSSSDMHCADKAENCDGIPIFGHQDKQCVDATSRATKLKKERERDTLTCEDLENELFRGSSKNTCKIKFFTPQISPLLANNFKNHGISADDLCAIESRCRDLTGSEIVTRELTSKETARCVVLKENCDGELLVRRHDSDGSCENPEIARKEGAEVRRLRAKSR